MPGITQSVTQNLVLLAAAAALGILVSGLVMSISVYIGRWFPSIAGRQLEVAGLMLAVVAIVVGAIYGIYIPKQLNDDNNFRQAKATCFTSVVSLRRSVNALNEGYTVAPLARDQRVADWEALRVELENTSFGCQGIDTPTSASTADLQRLRDDFNAAKKASEQPDPDADYLRRVTDWSLGALSELR